MQTNGICVYFAGAKGSLWEGLFCRISISAPIRDTLEACGLYASVDLSNFYPTIHDAVNAALSQKWVEDFNHQSTAIISGLSRCLNHLPIQSLIRRNNPLQYHP